MTRKLHGHHDPQQVVEHVEANWHGATYDERRELIEQLERAAAELGSGHDDLRSRIGALIDDIRSARSDDNRHVAPPPMAHGQGFGMPFGYPSSLDSDR